MRQKSIIDDGFHPELVEWAEFRGLFEIPTIHRPESFVIPQRLIPYSQRRKSLNGEEFLCFYEHDAIFADVLTSVKDHFDELSGFAGVISPDCSLYRDMPLCLQIANIYMSRAIGYYLQKRGLYVIPNVRWGDERTYTTVSLPEKVAFLGIDRHSIVSIGTYGCIRGKENRRHFCAGLEAMIETLEPEIVLVYGRMPNELFSGLEGRADFVAYPDWISSKRRAS